MEYWIVVGRELIQNKLSHLIVKSNRGGFQRLTPHQLEAFTKKNKVVNIKFSGKSMQGVGISLLNIPTYKKNNMGYMEQVGGLSEQEIIRHGQDLINQLIYDEQQKKQKEEANILQEKQRKINYVVNKLSLCNQILTTANQMKDITNNKVLIEHIGRYLKQLDIDNTDESISNLIQRYGVNGLANGISDKLKRCKEKATKDNILQEQINGITIAEMCNIVSKGIEELKAKHIKTKEIIKDNHKINVQTEDIPIVSEDEEDLIEIGVEPNSDIPIVNEDDTDLIELEDTPKQKTAKELRDEQYIKIPMLIKTYFDSVNTSIIKQGVIEGTTIERYQKYLENVVKNLIFDSNWQYEKVSNNGNNIKIIMLQESILDINDEFISREIRLNKRKIEQQLKEEKKRQEQQLKEEQQQYTEETDNLKRELRSNIGEMLCNKFIDNIDPITYIGVEYNYFDIVPLNILYLIAKMIKHWDEDEPISEFDGYTIKTYGNQLDYIKEYSIIDDEYNMSIGAACDALEYSLEDYVNILPNWFIDGINNICEHFKEDSYMNGYNYLKGLYDEASYNNSSYFEEILDIYNKNIDILCDSIVETAERIYNTRDISRYYELFNDL